MRKHKGLVTAWCRKKNISRGNYACVRCGYGLVGLAETVLCLNASPILYDFMLSVCVCVESVEPPPHTQRWSDVVGLCGIYDLRTQLRDAKRYVCRACAAACQKKPTGANSSRIARTHCT